MVVGVVRLGGEESRKRFLRKSAEAGRRDWGCESTPTNNERRLEYRRTAAVGDKSQRVFGWTVRPVQWIELDRRSALESRGLWAAEDC